MLVQHWREVGKIISEAINSKSEGSSNGSVEISVTNRSGLHRCGPGLKPDRMLKSGLLPGKQGYSQGGGTCLNWTAVPFYSSDNFGFN
jgi:hypothetical protein